MLFFPGPSAVRSESIWGGQKGLLKLSTHPPNQRDPEALFYFIFLQRWEGWRGKGGSLPSPAGDAAGSGGGVEVGRLRREL